MAPLAPRRPDPIGQGIVDVRAKTPAPAHCTWHNPHPGFVLVAARTERASAQVATLTSRRGLCPGRHPVSSRRFLLRGHVFSRMASKLVSYESFDKVTRRDRRPATLCGTCAGERRALPASSLPGTEARKRSTKTPLPCPYFSETLIWANFPTRRISRKAHRARVLHGSRYLA